MELELAQHGGGGSSFREPHGEGRASFVGGAKQALLLLWARCRGGQCSCWHWFGQRKHSVLYSDCGVPEGLLGITAKDAAGCPSVGLQHVSRAADWDPRLTCLYKLCVGVSHRHPLASSPLPHLQNQTLGNPPFCWVCWVSMFYSEVHSKYFH